MSTVSFIVYFLIVRLVSDSVTIKDKSYIWHYSIGIPLGLLILSMFLFGGNTSYQMGSVFGQFLLSTIGAIVYSYYLMNKKFKLNQEKNEK
jgi:hypothetical protein